MHRPWITTIAGVTVATIGLSASADTIDPLAELGSHRSVDSSSQNEHAANAQAAWHLLAQFLTSRSSAGLPGLDSDAVECSVQGARLLLRDDRLAALGSLSHEPILGNFFDDPRGRGGAPLLLASNEGTTGGAQNPIMWGGSSEPSPSDGGGSGRSVILDNPANQDDQTNPRRPPLVVDPPGPDQGDLFNRIIDSLRGDEDWIPGANDFGPPHFDDDEASGPAAVPLPAPVWLGLAGLLGLGLFRRRILR